MESWQPRAPVETTVHQYGFVCSKKLTVTIRSRLIPITADATGGRRLELRFTPPHSSQEWREVETLSSPVDVPGDPTWAPTRL